MSLVVGIVDTTTRDGNQSLWSATGLTTPDVLYWITSTIEGAAAAHERFGRVRPPSTG